MVFYEFTRQPKLLIHLRRYLGSNYIDQARFHFNYGHVTVIMKIHIK